FTHFNNRLRLVEDKTSNLNQKIEVIEKNMLHNFKKMNDNIKVLDKDILDLKHEMNTIRERTDLY
ncbi:hypothetical protein ACFLZB_01855, partial [Nanoarchaeota archaeon]